MWKILLLTQAGPRLCCGRDVSLSSVRRQTHAWTMPSECLLPCRMCQRSAPSLLFLWKSALGLPSQPVSPKPRWGCSIDLGSAAGKRGLCPEAASSRGKRAKPEVGARTWASLRVREPGGQRSERLFGASKPECLHLRAITGCPETGLWAAVWPHFPWQAGCWPVWPFQTWGGMGEPWGLVPRSASPTTQGGPWRWPG